MTEVILEQGVETIGKHVFAHCGKLQTITLPQSLTAIGDGAFWQCSNLNTITLPRNLKTIAKDAFWRCPPTLVFRVPAGSDAQSYCKQQGLNYRTY